MRVNDMSEVIDFSTKKEPTKEATIDEIEQFLSGYKEPLKIPTQDVNQTTGSIQQPTPPQSQPGGEFWKGDPRYYQRGAKKGQLRPTPLQARIKPVSTPANIEGNAIISGALLITLIDLLIPLAITAVNNLATDKKVKPEMLQMTQKQKDTLAPVCDQVAQYINLTGNPVIILTVSLIGIYGMNFLMIKQSIPNVKKQETPAKI